MHIPILVLVVLPILAGFLAALIAFDEGWSWLGLLCTLASVAAVFVVILLWPLVITLVTILAVNARVQSKRPYMVTHSIRQGDGSYHTTSYQVTPR